MHDENVSVPGPGGRPFALTVTSFPDVTHVVAANTPLGSEMQPNTTRDTAAKKTKTPLRTREATMPKVQ